MFYQESMGSNFQAAAVRDSSGWVITIYDFRLKRLIDTWVGKHPLGLYPGAAASVAERSSK